MSGNFSRYRLSRYKKSSAKKSTKSTQPSDERTANGYEFYIQEDQKLGNEANAAYENSYRPFNWQKKIHLEDFNESTSRNISYETNDGIKTLRQLACEKLAQMIIDHPEDLTDSVLQNSLLTWDGGWKYVWDIVAGSGNDSYWVFQRFANAFGQEKKFRCHGKQTYIKAFDDGRISTSITSNLLQSRLDCMNRRLVSSKSNHRIEIIPRLENVGSLVTELNSNQRFKFLTFLDLSINHEKKTWHRQVFLDIMALPSLMALDVSGSKNIDSGILKLWVVAIKNGQWKNMRLLDLGDCTGIINSSSLIELMEVSTENTKGRSGLIYLKIPNLRSSRELKEQLRFLAFAWASRHELIEKSKQTGLRFPKHEFSANFGLAKKFIFLRNWFNNLSNNEFQLLVDPEVGANYIRKRYLLQEFVLNSGFKLETNTSTGLEYFRTSWPLKLKRSLPSDDYHNISNGRENPRHKIRKDSRTIEKFLGL